MMQLRHFSSCNRIALLKWVAIRVGWMVWVGFMGWMGSVVPAQAQPISSPVAHPSEAQAMFWQKLAQAQVVYLGETHDSAADHEAQLALIQRLHQLNPSLAIGLEMFQRPFQEVLDQYLAGQITEADLRQQSEYDQRWRFPWEFYAPILRFAKTHQIPLIALNTPTEVTRQVAKSGLDQLTPEAQTHIPPRQEIDLSNLAYRQYLLSIYQTFHKPSASGQPMGNSQSFERFLQAQVLWDETMAAAIAQSLQRHPQRTVVVLAGQGHLLYGYGIPSRVARRVADKASFRQYTILLNPAADLQQEQRVQEPSQAPIANFFWFTTPDGGRVEKIPGAP